MNADYQGLTKKALLLGVHDEDYPRNKRLREFLCRELGIGSQIILVDDNPGYLRKFAHLLRSGLGAKRGSYDLIVSPEFSHKYAVAAWVVARYHHAPLVVDWFVGLHETRVGDWGRPDDFKARAAALLDSIAARAGSFLITDTAARVSMLQGKFGAGPQTYNLPVGAPPWARPKYAIRTGRIKVLYYGSYQPLHGLDFFLDAVSASKSVAGLHFTFIGSGSRREDFEKRVKGLALEVSFRFIDSVPEAELSAHIVASDVVLGIFGESPKAKSVIANKIWQSLSSNRIVVTRQSSALTEIRDLAGPLLVEVMSISDLATILDTWAQNPTDLRKISLPDIDTRLEDYVQSQFSIFGNALQKSL